jgi:general secretion pathway protein F
MPVFSYRAMNQSGKTVKGVVDADGPSQARQKLRTDGLYVVEINPSGNRRIRDRLPAVLSNTLRLRRSYLPLVTEATRQLATLLAAGVPLVTALATLQEQAGNQEFGRMLAMIREDVTRGDTLHAALARHCDAFSMEYIQLVRAGEMAGSLDNVLLRQADNLEKRADRHAKVVAALAYPAFMTLVGFGVLIFILTFIVPTLTGLFDTLEAALPWPTQLLLALSGLLQHYWYLVLLAILLLVVGINRYLTRKANYRRAERLLFLLPIVGPLMKKLLIARAIRSLTVLSTGGVPLTTTLTVSADSLGKSAFAAALRQAAVLVGQGLSLADALGKSDLFPPIVLRMIAVGEQSGALSEMLERAAESHENQTDRMLSALTSLMEPIIILVMGLVVGFIVLAVLLPIFDLSGLVR